MINNLFKHRILNCIIVIFLFLYPIIVFGESFCDDRLKKIKKSKETIFSYQERGDRCEGFYGRYLSNISTRFKVLSFTTNFEIWNPSTLKSLFVIWRNLIETPIFIKVRCIMENVNYAMDTKVNPLQFDKFQWDGTILKKAKLHRNDIGVIAFTEIILDNKRQKLYLPICVSEKEEFSQEDYYNVILIPGENFKEVFISLLRIDNINHKVFEDRPLERKYYSNKILRLNINKPKISGLYILSIYGVNLRGRRSITREIFFRVK